MQDEPRNISFSAPWTWEAWITLVAMIRLSYRNSARSVSLATMPPTLAAARNTACGRLAANQPDTAACSRKSTSLRRTVSSSTCSCTSRRISAAPTMPRCPATKTVLPFSSNGVLSIGGLPPGGNKIARDHFLHELDERRFRLPAELCTRLGGVADQQIDLCGAEIHGIDANQRLTGFLVDACFVDPLTAPRDHAANLGQGQFDEFAHRAGFAGRQHEIVRLIRLQHKVHALDIILGVAPVTLRRQVPEIQRILDPGLDTGDAARDLARHKTVSYTHLTLPT